MRSIYLALSGIALVTFSFIPTEARAQAPGSEIFARVEAARIAAGSEHQYLFGQTCGAVIRGIGAEPAATTNTPRALPSVDPDPERDWYAEPVRVFDDLFFLGQTGYSVWGLRTSEGIILVDAIFEYSAEEEVLGGLRRLGIDPAEIRYLIISHAHGDHSGGAGVLQRAGARVIMSEADWDLYERGRGEVMATRDIVATDGMEITLGDHTVRTYLTPGHTLGTLSTILPVHDNGVPHVAALWGGTLFNFRDAPGDPRDTRLGMYRESASRFRAIGLAAGADIILSNHTAYDGSTVKMPILAQRRPGQPHPYAIGTEAVADYLTVAEECSIATRLFEAAPGV